MRTITIITLLFTLAACGGGGTMEEERTEQLPTNIPSVPAPELPASSPAQ